MLALKVPPTSDAVYPVTAAIPEKLGRLPLIILDQFNDYQTRHRDRFSSRNTWLKAGRLCEQNGFWRDLRELLLSAKIHLVVVTRTDTALGGPEVCNNLCRPSDCTSALSVLDRAFLDHILQ